MKFHLGSQPYKIFINGQLLKIQQLGYLGILEKPLEEYTLTVYWRHGVQDVIVNRIASQNSEAPLARLYSGDTVYTGDTLEISVSEVSGYSVSSYQQKVIVTGDTEIYIEPQGETPICYSQEICLPSNDTLEIVPDKSYESAYITADFDVQLLWNNMHWDSSVDFAYITDIPLEIYKLDSNWYYELQTANGDGFTMSTEEQASYIRRNGIYLGTIWVGYEQNTEGLWYITYKIPKVKLSANSTQELMLDSSHVLEVTKLVSTPDEPRDYEAYNFTADFQAKYLCQSNNWGTSIIDTSYVINYENSVDIYEFNTYDDTGYQEVLGIPENEASYIQEHGQYIGSVYVDEANCWQIVYKEELANG